MLEGREWLMMRTARTVLAAVLAASLVLAAAPAAMAVSKPVPRRHPLYKVSVPRVASRVVKMDVPFEASGSVLPTVAPDATVTVQVFGIGARGRRFFEKEFVATTAPAARGTSYSAQVSLPGAGAYALIAVVRKGGKVVACSGTRMMKAVLPYRISIPRVARSVVATGVAFEASGSVVPTIGPGDTATVALQVFRVNLRGGHLNPSGVADIAATVTGDGSGYSALVTLPKVGVYALVAVVKMDGKVVGRSAPRIVTARPKPPTVTSR
jgi:hypothetical protein